MRAVPQLLPMMRERIRMLAPTSIVHDPPPLLGDLRQALSLRPALADFPAQLAEHLKAEERAIRACLEVLYLEGHLCP